MKPEVAQEIIMGILGCGGDVRFIQRPPYTVCTLVIPDETGSLVGVGFSKCNPCDTFSPHVGAVRALVRACLEIRDG